MGCTMGYELWKAVSFKLTFVIEFSEQYYGILSVSPKGLVFETGFTSNFSEVSIYQIFTYLSEESSV